MTKPRVNVTLPVYNEVGSLETNVKKLLEYLRPLSAWEFEIVIADNGSEDGTWLMAQRLEKEHGIHAVHLNLPGRGGTLKHVWMESQAEVLSYMDIDLSTDLSAFPGLITPILEDESDLVVGSRLLKASKTQRGWKRELLSRSYNKLLKQQLNVCFTDAQCGFKAISRRAAKSLIPQVKDNQWFMDTELLVKAEKQHYRIKELPVTWKEDTDSRVKIISTVWQDIRGIRRLCHEMRQ
jgi:glycosyltransferase involved in cell wall biosynthesis